MTTDNAYVGSQKVLVTPDISGKISKVVVREGQRVQVGDVLFEIDAEPFRLALQQAEARVANVRTDHANLLTNDKAMSRMIELAQKTADLKRQDVERKMTLMANRSGSQFDLDSSNAQLVVAQTQVEQLSQQQAGIRNQLLGNPELPLEQFPPFLQAKAALDQAQRDLNHTTVRAPLAGNATQVDNIQHRPLRQRRHAGAERDRRHASLGGRQSEGNRFHPCRAGPDGDDRRRRLSRITPSRAASPR